MKLAMTLLGAAVLSACATLPGKTPQESIKPLDGYAIARSLSAPEGQWPAAGWWKAYGDTQLDTLIDEGLASSPSVANADARLRRAWELFGDELIATTSFGRDAALLLHHLHRLNIPVRVYFMDTGFHFPETLAYRDTLVKDWGLNVQTVSSDRPDAERRQYAVNENGANGTTSGNG